MSKDKPKSLDADDNPQQELTNGFQPPPAPEKVEVEYGSIVWPPICPCCKRGELPPEKRKEVRCIQLRTKGPIAYYKCPACEWHAPPMARPWRPKHWGEGIQQLNVAARPDMGKGIS